MWDTTRGASWLGAHPKKNYLPTYIETTEDDDNHSLQFPLCLESGMDLASLKSLGKMDNF